MNLIIKSLNFSYQNEEVFKDLNLNFNSGILNLVSGPSGSGKTTLLNLIAGLEKPSSGLIMLDDNIQSSIDKFVEPENRNIGFVFQDFALFPHLNVKQNIEFSRNGNKELFNTFINNLSIKNHLSKYPHELSGGQQQRVSIARALYSEPKILLVDEPISNQDRNNKIEIIKIISDFAKEKEIICILVSHEDINNSVQVETRSYTLS
tara:strand:- start:40 stop:657 length:618 start_codon:yes stop_codon:yes gene_type:complete